MGLQTYGISFDDAAFAQRYTRTQTGENGEPGYASAFAGPLSGGTTKILQQSASLLPSVWFGSVRGTAALGDDQQLSVTSPPGTAPGPVNVKLNFPDGTQWFYPQFFGYSTFPQYAFASGSAPQGGAAGEVIGYGLPVDAGDGAISVGGVVADITTKAGQSPPLSGEPFPSTKLDFVLPPGQPGWADMEVSSPIGWGSLPHSVFYAKSVVDYATGDKLNSLLYDWKRNVVYAAAGAHVDVFSMATHKFLKTLIPASRTAARRFTGMALTPDGSQLLVANFSDGSLAIINPDAPATTSVISIPNSSSPGVNCPNGPLYVAATSDKRAFVVTGGFLGIACPAEGTTYIVDLKARAVTTPDAYTQCGISGDSNSYFPDGYTVDASGDGNYVAIGGSDYSRACLYSVKSATYTPLAVLNAPLQGGIAVARDGNWVASGPQLMDTGARKLGDVAQPFPLYPYGDYASIGSTEPPAMTLHPRFNSSGGLYFRAYPNFIEIIDVPHGLLRMRFALTQQVANMPAPMAVDQGGRYIFLITDKGLTEIDLGAALLSIGSLNVPAAAPGTAVKVRGSGFQHGMTATVGKAAATVNVLDENTLMLTIPGAPAGPQDIVLTRPDGETYTLESAIVVK